MKNQVEYEGIVDEDPKIIISKKNLKIAEIILGQEEKYKDFSKINLITFKGFAQYADKVETAKKGDYVTIKARLSGREYAGKDGRIWKNIDLVINDFNIETQALGAPVVPSVPQELDQLPF